jgi:asparagine synthase (glutamine-hydrolysing)
MCGICGLIDYRRRDISQILSDMVSALHHRGPDDHGTQIFQDETSVVGLGHTRLSILDLSPAGHQPMHYKQWCITLNGEIYNFKEIRKELQALGHQFKSESDTEVVLHAFDQWGSNAVSRFIGMFAFAIYNKTTKEIFITRDRAGVKPLYIYRDEHMLLFASELKSFLQNPEFRKRIRPESVRLFIEYGYVPAPYCIFENCFKLEPGTILKYNTVNKTVENFTYWDVRTFYEKPNIAISYEDAKEVLENILTSAFSYRMVSDVPVGIFLSGGYDSIGVAAILQSNNLQKLRTFTIGFEEGNNEAPFANQVAAFLGTNHTEYYCTTREAQEIIPSLPYYYDEPFADSSAIPTILVSQMARKHVTVALSADAGDEIFAGYNNYRTLFNNLKLIQKVPGSLRKPLGMLAGMSTRFIPDGLSRYKLSVLSESLKMESSQMTRFLLRTYYTSNSYLTDRLLPEIEKNIPTVYDDDITAFKDPLSIALSTDFQMYLQNDILTKVDRATMSVALEGREPYLDHRIVEFAATLPGEFKFGTIQKLILKDIIHKYVPSSLMQRPKTGFSVPIYSWLKKDLSPLLEDNLNRQAINHTGFFDIPTVMQLKKRFMESNLPDSTIIWKLIQFQMWYRQWIG